MGNPQGSSCSEVQVEVGTAGGIAGVVDHGNVDCGVSPSASPSTTAAAAAIATTAAVASASSASAVSASDGSKRSATPTTSTAPSPQKQKSTLSRGKLQFIKKHFRSTPWYDTEELLSVGDGLLIALQLFPMVPPAPAAPTVSASASASGGGAGQEVTTTGLMGADEGGEEGQNMSVGQSQQLPLLSPADCHRLQHSLRRVAVWKGSSRGTKIGGGDSGGGGGGGAGGGGSVLPHAIESTACLAGILWADAMASSTMAKPTSSISSIPKSSSNMNGVINLNQLRNAYSSAIIRSVNALADSYRRVYSNTTNGVNTDMPPPSVSHCACTLAGLPAWIVDVRHDASHGAALPTIHVCRLASLEILRYWKDKYWSKVEERVWGQHRVVGGRGGEERVECGMHTQAYDILARYQTSAILELRSSSGGGARHLPADRNGLGRRDHRQQQHRPKECVESRTCMATIPQSSGVGEVVSSIANGMMETERSNNIHMPSIDASTAHVRDKCVDKGPMSNDTTTSTTLAIDNNRRRQRPRKMESGGGIPWWILMDDDAPAMQKKKKKKESKDGDAVSDDKTNDNPSATDPTDKVRTEPVVAAPPTTTTTTVATPRDCALEFIRTIPLDIAYSTCLRFLVWGRKRTVEDGRQSTAATAAVAIHEYDDDNQFIVGDQNIACPALLTLPSDFLPGCDQRAEAPQAAATEAAVEEEEAKFDSSFEHLRIMYEPLLVTMTTVYPGFAPALFVHLVDSIICLEKIAGDESHDEKKLDCYIQYLSRWVQYLLSRAFHMHLNRSVAMFAPDEAVMQNVQQKQQFIPNPSQQSTQQLSQAANREENIMEKSLPRPVLVDLKKRGRKKWNAAQLRYMQSPLDFPLLRDIGLSLNSASDRLLLVIQQRSTNTRRKITTSKVMQLHQYLLDVIGEEDRILFMGISALRSGSAVMESLKAHDEPLLLPVSSETNKMSLEDMEAMLGDGDRKDGGGASTYTHSLDKDNYGPTGLIEEKMHIVTPWTLCKSWDACAIGTISGYPS